MRRMERLVVIAGLLAVAARAGAEDFLLVAESTDKTVGKFDPNDGTYLGVFATVPQVYGSTSIPINAVPGPDGRVYVSDQNQDAVFVFEADGTYGGVFVDSTDGLDNVRGIAWRGENLFVCHAKAGAKSVREFDLTGELVGDFITNVDPFDIHFLADGSALVADLQDPDAVRWYGSGGAFIADVFSISFPEQINDDPQLPGALLNIAFSGAKITDFDASGVIHSQVTFSSGRGIWRLGNGNLLATDGSGVYEVDPANGVKLATKQAAVSGRYIELFATSTPPTGACCVDFVGGCQELSAAGCAAAGGRFQGEGSTCTPAGACGCKGDCDCNGIIDFEDINPFIDALSGSAPCSSYNVDVNDDGLVDFDDINPFVDVLSAGAACP